MLVTGKARLLSLQPSEAARELSEAASQEWLTELVASLVEARPGSPDPATARQSLARICRVWGLSQAQAATLFGVSRQALGKWLSRGVPSERLEAVAYLAAATDILVHYLKPDRIPAVVRRKATRLGGKSLLDLVRADHPREVLEACRKMFRFEGAHG